MFGWGLEGLGLLELSLAGRVTLILAPPFELGAAAGARYARSNRNPPIAKTARRIMTAIAQPPLSSTRSIVRSTVGEALGLFTIVAILV